MNLFKSQLLQEAPRFVAGPYRQSFARRYGRRVERGQVLDDKVGTVEPRVDVPMQEAERTILRTMADYDIAA